MFIGDDKTKQFIKKGDKVSKGQTLLIIEAMKVMNNISSPKIKVIDLTGNNLRELITPSDASDPAWSALLP